MLEIGRDEIAASELAEQKAQEAAYLSANRMHDEAEESSNASTPSDEIISYSTTAFKETRQKKRTSIASSRSSRTIQDRRRADEANVAVQSDYDEEEETDVFPDIPARPASRYLAPELNSPALHRRPSSTISSNSSANDTPSLKKRNSFFGSLGRKRKDTDNTSVTSTNQGPFPLVASSRDSTHSSNETSSLRDGERRRNSILPPFPGDSSASTKSRRIISGAPSVESDIGDATYVSYSSGRPRRSASDTGSILSSRGGIRGMTDSQLLARNERSGDKKSCLRVKSRYHGAKSLTFMPPSPISVCELRLSCSFVERFID